MKRWCSRLKQDIESEKVDAFLKEILEVYEKHGLSISHEDGHGAFIVEQDSQDNRKWIMEAMIGEGAE